MTEAPESHFDGIRWRSDCPISSALDLLGDKWSLVILRDLLLTGERTYSDFLGSAEGISTNVLADRLTRLQRNRLVHRDTRNGSRNAPYRLTAAGAALEPVLRALAEWATSQLAEVHPTILAVGEPTTATQGTAERGVVSTAKPLSEHAEDPTCGT